MSKANFKFCVKNAKEAYWEKFCGKLNYHSKLTNVWKTIKLLNNNSKQSNKIILNSENDKLIDDKMSADKFAKNYSQISSNENIDKNSFLSRSNTIQEFFKSRNKSDTNKDQNLRDDSNKMNELFSRSEFEFALKSVSIHSAPGIDLISNIFLVKSPEVIKNYLMEIINLIWKTGDIPTIWKTSIIKPVLKPNKKSTELNSYRPISLTSNSSKIMEKMIVNRLSWYLEKNNLINGNQAGFRKGFCTSDPIIRLKYEADHAVKSGNITVAVLIDFTSAFDLLWADGLLIKMMNLNITGRMLKWTKNFLSNRIAKVKIGEEFSESFSPENGTPQGSAISPLLFIIMVNDFPKLSNFTSNAFFADDCTIWRSGKNINQIIHHLQEDLNLIANWCSKWGFQINTNKTIGIIFTNKIYDSKLIKLTINDRLVNFQSSCKLLGVLFDSHLTWGPQIVSVIDMTKKCLNILRCISGTNWGTKKVFF